MIPDRILMDVIARQSPNSSSNIATHPSEVVLVNANEVVLQHLHLSTHPGVDKRPPKHFQLGGLCSGSGHNQRGTQEKDERANTLRPHHLVYNSVSGEQGQKVVRVSGEAMAISGPEVVEVQNTTASNHPSVSDPSFLGEQ